MHHDASCRPWTLQHRLQRCSAHSIEAPVAGPPSLAARNGLGTPWNPAYDRRADVLWMCDGDLARISKLSLEGRVLGWFGSDGSEPGQLHQVHSIAVGRDGAIYAAETVNGRIQKFVRAD